MDVFDSLAQVVDKKPPNPCAELARLLFLKSKHPASQNVLEAIDWESAVNTPIPSTTNHTSTISRPSGPTHQRR